MTRLTTTYFETSRLRGRSFSAADVEALVAYRANPGVARYQSWSDYIYWQIAMTPAGRH